MGRLFSGFHQLAEYIGGTYTIYLPPVIGDLISCDFENEALSYISKVLTR